MTNLTEQLKKGKLKLGEHYYYTTIFSPTVHIQNFTRDVISFQDFKETVAEVLAPVPSYEEYQSLLSDQLAKNEGVEINNELEERLKKTQKLELDLRRENRNLKKWCEEFNALDVAKENAHLKELLKECQNKLVCYKPYDKAQLLKKIDQVLGENTDEI